MKNMKACVQALLCNN